MDTWYGGLVRTLDVLDAAGLEHVGTYRTQQERDTVKIIDVGGIKLAMLAYTFSTNGSSAICRRSRDSLPTFWSRSGTIRA